MFLLPVLLQWCLCSALQFHHEGQSDYYFSPYLMEEGLQVFNVTALCIVVNPEEFWDATWDDPAKGAAGKIAVLVGTDHSGKFRDDYAFRAMELGMMGVVDRTSWVPDHFGQIRDPDALVNIDIPYVSISEDDNAAINRSVDFINGIAMMTLMSDDSPNTWPTMFESWGYIIVWRGALAVFGFVLGCIAAHRLGKGV